MSRAKKEIDPKALDIEILRVKRAVTGVLIYEVTDDNKAAEANSLAVAQRRVIPPEEAKTARPHKTGDLRINGLDKATTTADVAETVAQAGACIPAEVRVGLSPSGMFSAWMQCPLAAANKVAAVGKIKVGWVVALATLLAQKPLQCFRCLERGACSRGMHQPGGQIRGLLQMWRPGPPGQRVHREKRDVPSLQGSGAPRKTQDRVSRVSCGE
jgi:hypothetical protein